MLVVKMSLNSRKFAALAPLSGGHLGQFPRRAFPCGLRDLDWVGGRAGLGPEREQGEREQGGERAGRRK